MNNHIFDPKREGGISILERLTLIVLLLFVGIKVMATVGPPLYDYYILKDLAKRVAKEYTTLSEIEVNKRVRFELDRAQIAWDEEVFKITPLGSAGYMAAIDYHIPLVIQFGDYKLGEDKNIHLTFKAEP